jgi:hypothetical protein
MTIPPQVMTRTVGDEVVILDLASGTYFGLDPVGARVWELMTDGLSLGEICTQMLAEYEVAREDLERDVLSLAAELLEQHLIAVRGNRSSHHTDDKNG